MPDFVDDTPIIMSREDLELVYQGVPWEARYLHMEWGYDLRLCVVMNFTHSLPTKIPVILDTDLPIQVTSSWVEWVPVMLWPITRGAPLIKNTR